MSDPLCRITVSDDGASWLDEYVKDLNTSTVGIEEEFLLRADQWDSQTVSELCDHVCQLFKDYQLIRQEFDVPEIHGAKAHLELCKSIQRRIDALHKKCTDIPQTFQKVAEALGQAQAACASIIKQEEDRVKNLERGTPADRETPTGGRKRLVYPLEVELATILQYAGEIGNTRFLAECVHDLLERNDLASAPPDTILRRLREVGL